MGVDAGTEYRYYRTVIEVEVISEEPYEPETLAQVVEDAALNGEHIIDYAWSIKGQSTTTLQELGGTDWLPNVYVWRDNKDRQPRVGIDWYHMKVPYAEKVASLTVHTKGQLVRAIINYHYNSFCDAQSKGGESLIPYMGWFWRNIDFCGGVSVGKAVDEDDQPVGFMGKNKWGYPERTLTEGERMQVLGYLDRAMMSDTEEGRKEALCELWQYMQTLEVPGPTSSSSSSAG